MMILCLWVKGAVLYKFSSVVTVTLNFANLAFTESKTVCCSAEVSPEGSRFIGPFQFQDVPLTYSPLKSKYSTPLGFLGVFLLAFLLSAPKSQTSLSFFTGFTSGSVDL